MNDALRMVKILWQRQAAHAQTTLGNRMLGIALDLDELSIYDMQSYAASDRMASRRRPRAAANPIVILGTCAPRRLLPGFSQNNHRSFQIDFCILWEIVIRPQSADTSNEKQRDRRYARGGTPGIFGAPGIGAPGAAGAAGPGIAAGSPLNGSRQNGHLLGRIPSEGNTVLPQFAHLTGCGPPPTPLGLKHMIAPFLSS